MTALILIALEVLLLVVALRWGSLGHGRAFTRKQRQTQELRRGRALVALSLVQATRRELAAKAPNGQPEGTRYEPAPSSGPQRIVE
jgi:hypothetical protein